MPIGTATINFGAFPGTDRAVTAISGQAAFLTTSAVEAWIAPDATTDHSEDEVMMLTHFVRLSVPQSLKVNATGFTVVAVCHDGPLHGLIPFSWAWS